MALLKESKGELVRSFALRENDTGSPEVQVALMTERINQLTEHLKVHKKDYASRRGLLMMVGDRVRLLRHLERTDKQRYLTLIKRLDIRK